MGKTIEAREDSKSGKEKGLEVLMRPKRFCENKRREVVEG